MPTLRSSPLLQPLPDVLSAPTNRVGSRVADPGFFHLLDPDPDPGVAKMINFVTITEDYLEI